MTEDLSTDRHGIAAFHFDARHEAAASVQERRAYARGNLLLAALPSEDWLRLQDTRREQIMPILEEVYGEEAEIWFQRWRVLWNKKVTVRIQGVKL